MIEGFLLGVIVTCSFVAAGFFARFWYATRDLLFLGFAAAFFLEALNRTAFLFLDKPNVGEEADLRGPPLELPDHPCGDSQQEQNQTVGKRNGNRNARFDA